MTSAGLGQQPDDTGVQDATPHDDTDQIRILDHHGCRPTAGKQSLVHHVESAALVLHQSQVVEHASKPVVATSASVQDIGRRYPERQWTDVDDLQAIGIQGQEDVATLRVRTVHESVDEKLPDNALVVGRDTDAQQPIRQLVALLEVRHPVANGIDELDRR